MKLRKTFLVLSTLFILCGSSLALAVSDVPTGDVSGETTSGENTSGDPTTPSVPTTSGEPTPSGDVTPSGEISGDVTQSGDLDLSGDPAPVVPSGDLKELASTANDSTFKIYKNAKLEGAMEATTSGDETFKFVIVTEPTHGSVSHSDETSPSFTYVPTADYTGKDSFTFRLESGEKYSNVGTVTINVEVDPATVIPFNYTDMQQHWANYSASHLAARGYIIGEKISDDYYFCPDKTMTRGDFLLYILSIVDPTGKANEADVKFADENSIPDWMLKKAKQAYELEIIKGVGDASKTYLYYDRPITRAEAFVMINNALLANSNSVNSSADVKYKDADNIPAWALQAVKTLSAYKIIQGDTSNYINTSGIVSRGQGAELCFKLLKQIEASALAPSGDTSGDIK